MLEHLPDTKQVHPKTLSKHMDNLGFREMREHTREGSGWILSYEVFENIILPLFPSFSSQSSQIGSNNKNQVTQCDEKVESVTNHCDECDANDECDGAYDQKLVHAACVICGQNPCDLYDPISGKPYCQDCYGSKKVNDEQ